MSNQMSYWALYDFGGVLKMRSTALESVSNFDQSLKNLIWKQSRLKKIWHGTVTKVLYIQESRKYRSNRVRPIRGQDNYQTRNLKMRKWIQLIRQLQTEKQLSISKLYGKRSATIIVTIFFSQISLSGKYQRFELNVYFAFLSAKHISTI